MRVEASASLCAHIFLSDTALRLQAECFCSRAVALRKGLPKDTSAPLVRTKQPASAQPPDARAERMTSAASGRRRRSGESFAFSGKCGIEEAEVNGMLKAVFADELLAGDVVIPVRGANELVVRSVRVFDESGSCEVEVIDPKNGWVFIKTGSRNQILGLVYRPRRPEKTERDMLGDVIVALIETGTTTDREVLKKRLPPLREAIEAYELANPVQPDCDSPLEHYAIP